MDNSQYVLTCCFLDVGQGTSQVILLDKQRAIVVDTGVHPSQVHNFLLNNDIKIIELLILSHNDKDHIGGVKNLINTYKANIKKIGFLCDRPPKDNKLLSMLKNEKKSKLEYKLVRLETESNDEKKLLFREGNTSLFVMYPDFKSNINYKKNAACAIVSLEVGSQKVIFSGDALVGGWKYVVDNYGKQSVQILTVPHHGSSNFADNEEDYKYFFENIETQYAIISVGYNNRYGHPVKEIIQSYVKKGTEIFCTQSNQICNPKTATANKSYLSCEIDITCCSNIEADIGVNRTEINNIERLRECKERFPNRLCKSIE
ncbi:MAG: MBL fold metallo-hydrolase [Bacteroidales bacterium]|jgi:competence protein ComEC|nr:MBL fold metallo-hydrolase [Bacteroidales bacterium]